MSKSNRYSAFKKAPFHGCLVHFVNITNYAFLCTLELNVKKKLLANDKTAASCPTNIYFPSMYRTLQTTKMNFEKLLG